VSKKLIHFCREAATETLLKKKANTWGKIQRASSWGPYRYAGLTTPTQKPFVLYKTEKKIESNVITWPAGD